MSLLASRRPRSMGWQAAWTTRCIRFYSKLVAKLFRLDVKIYHKERIPMSGPVLVVGNHESMADPLVWASVVRRNGAVLAMHSLWHNPVTRPIVKLRGDIPVKRHSGKGRGDALEAAVNILRHGGLVGLFPAGKISRKGEDHEWRKGFAEMALETGATIVPIRMRGVGELLPLAGDRTSRFAWFSRRAAVWAVVGEPVTPDMYRGLSAPDLADMVRSRHSALQPAA